MQNDNEKFKSEFKRRVYEFVLRLIKFLSLLNKNAVTITLIDQTMRSGTSILGKYIEARASSSRREFTNYFQYSLKSANETAIWLCLLRDTRNGDEKEITYLLKEVDEIAKIFASSIIKLKGKR